MTRHLPTAALLTDFGVRDQYVGVIKSVLFSLCPRMRIIDISHDVTRQSVREGAYLLWSSYRYLPAGTVVLAVVDPGVGTSRDILLARTKRHVFVAPDNGLLDLVLWEEKKQDLYTLDLARRIVRNRLPESVSATFHGRDIMAPVCALLASGIAPGKIGRKVSRAVGAPPFVNHEGVGTSGRVLHVDHFGNIITNVVPHEHLGRRFPYGVRIGNTLVARWIDTYADAPPDTPCLIVGSSGLVEIVINQRNAAALLLTGTDALEVIR